MATYHVNPITGSDVTGDGTAGNPWATIKFTVQSGATSGDEIRVVGTSTTDVDSAATFVNVNTAIINTSVDLTSQFVVGDICIISPKYTGAPEFDGWMTYEVRGVTATTLDLGNTRNPFPNGATNLFTISKFDTFVNCGAAGNIEDFSTGITVNAMAGITIVGGYDTTFTTIIGTTVYRRTGLNYNANAGNIFRPYTQSTGRGDVFARFENFTVSKFGDCFRNSFGAGIIATNINFHGINGAGPTVGGIYIPGSIADIYCSNSAWGQNGQYASRNVGGPPVFQGEACNAFINNQNRHPTFSSSTVNNIVGWTNTLNAAGSPFGLTGLIRGENMVHAGSLSFIPLDSSKANGFATALYSSGNSVYKPTSIKVVNDGATSNGAQQTVLGSPLSFAPLYFVSVIDSITGASVLVLPAGLSITDLNTRMLRSTAGSNGLQMQFGTIVEGSNIWTAGCTGVYATADTTEFSTGDSSKKVLIPMPGYADGLKIVTLYTFLKTGSITSFTIRYKTQTSSAFNGSINLISSLPDAQDGANLMTNSVSFAASTSGFTDITIPVNTSTKAYGVFETWPTGFPVTIGISCGQSNNLTNNYTWIDSVTVNV